MIPEQLHPYPDHFAFAQRNFVEAARVWTEERLPTLYLQDSSLHDDIITKMTMAVKRFDAGILSDYAQSILKAVDNAVGVVFWSEGDEDIQNAKMDVAINLLNHSITRDPGHMARIASSDKFEQLGDVSLVRERIKTDTGINPHLVLIEDKITNMVKFFEKRMNIPFYPGINEDDPFSYVKEEDLDNPYFRFEDYLQRWQSYIINNPELFTNYKFLYVPPDKPLGANGIIGASQLRQKRIKQWIAASNAALKDTRKYPDKSSERFFNIADNPDLNSIITSHSLVVTDLDGVLTSQKKILDSREEVLQEEFRNQAEAATLEHFGLTIAQLAAFLSMKVETMEDEQNRLVAVWDVNREKPYLAIGDVRQYKPEESVTQLLVRDTTSDPNVCIITLLKYPPLGYPVTNDLAIRSRTQDLRWRHRGIPRNPQPYQYTVNILDYLKALQSIGYQFPPGNDMLQ